MVYSVFKEGQHHRKIKPDVYNNVERVTAFYKITNKTTCARWKIPSAMQVNFRRGSLFFVLFFSFSSLFSSLLFFLFFITIVISPLCENSKTRRNISLRDQKKQFRTEDIARYELENSTWKLVIEKAFKNCFSEISVTGSHKFAIFNIDGARNGQKGI